ncbi:MAG: TetR/AcrR family transcriptional regulator [Clostridiaceae bacterium]|nr:TetR/AcrR family transcriptional regulator [Clostridiaceae bacterium]
MRISKAPEERKQEIIDTAMKLFSEKGYEFTSISDIAKEMNVVSGLCYRYFKSKEEIYKTAISLYAKECSAPIIDLLSKDYSSIEEYMENFSAFFLKTDKQERYHSFFHQSKNEFFSKQLQYEMIKLIEPYSLSLLERMAAKKLINITNPKETTRFLLYGQMPIIDDDSLSSKDKLVILNNLMIRLFK